MRSTSAAAARAWVEPEPRIAMISAAVDHIDWSEARRKLSKRSWLVADMSTACHLFLHGPARWASCCADHAVERGRTLDTYLTRAGNNERPLTCVSAGQGPFSGGGRYWV